MAAVTKSVAFGVTSCTTFEPPFLLAKRFSTLDHITNGRIAWVRRLNPRCCDHNVLQSQNIVTSWSDNAARAVGLDRLPEHDKRYDMADEYLNLMYKYVSRLFQWSSVLLPLTQWYWQTLGRIMGR